MRLLVLVAAHYPVLVEMFSDAQCPCSAQFVSDIAKTLATPGADTLVDFNQYFVSGSFLSNKPAPDKCIHGAKECLGQRFFLCARGDWGNASTFRSSSAWLDFQRCAYGPCSGCAAIKGPQCPCEQYTNFTDVGNGILEGCARDLQLSWSELEGCATGASGRGEQLFEASSNHAYGAGVFYGLQGLPVVHVNGQRVHTRQLLPLTCGPTPAEVLAAICDALPTKLPACHAAVVV